MTIQIQPTTWAQNNPSLGPKWDFWSSLKVTIEWQLKVLARCKYADDLPGAAECLNEIERELKTARQHLLTSIADGGAK